MKNIKSGFSLIELLITIVIIGIIAALAIPGYLASRRGANEGATLSVMRMLHSSQMTYSTSYGEGQFAGDVGAPGIAGLTALHARGFIDEVVASGTKSGYNIAGARRESTAILPAQFFFSAIPISADNLTGTGSRRFGIATNGVMKADTTLTVHFADGDEVDAAPPSGN